MNPGESLERSHLKIVDQAFFEELEGAFLSDEFLLPR